MEYATKKQIEYATAISVALKVDLPSVCSKSLYGKFISEHKADYDREFLRKRIYGDESYSYLPERNFGNDMGKEVTDWIIQKLYKKVGLYAFLDKNEVIYIGKSKNLAERIPSSYSERKFCGRINRILFYLTETNADANILEIILISEYKPILNRESNTQDRSLIFRSNLSILNDFDEIPLFKGVSDGSF